MMTMMIMMMVVVVMMIMMTEVEHYNMATERNILV
jgi:hypothetical protein